MLRFLLLFLVSSAQAETGRLILHFLQLPVGEETYELANNTLRSHFEYTERNSKVALDATLKLKADLTPEQFEAHGRSYRPFSVDVSVTPGRETVPFFTISGYTPLSVQMMMLRYWRAHGRPHRLKQLPAASPESDLIIEETGHDVIADGTRLVRYSVGNVVWGRESVWLNPRQELAAASTYAGNLPLEAVREEYRAALPQLMRSALADRMKELAALSTVVRNLAKPEFAIVNALLIDGNGGAPVDNATVVVKDGRITAAGLRDQIAIPRNAERIDAHGQALLPGLWEMHAHFAQVEYAPAYLATGVTTARDCGGEFEFLTAIRDLLNARGGIGPRLVLAGLVDGSGPGTFARRIGPTRRNRAKRWWRNIRRPASPR